MIDVGMAVVHRLLRTTYPCQHARVDCSNALVIVERCDYTNDAGIANKLAVHLKLEAARGNNQQSGQERRAISQQM
jgi:hypothetical protein